MLLKDGRDMWVRVKPKSLSLSDQYEIERMLYEWMAEWLVGCSVVKYLRRARRHFSPVSTTINWSRMPEAAHRPGLQGVRTQFDAVVSWRGEITSNGHLAVRRAKEFPRRCWWRSIKRPTDVWRRQEGEERFYSLSGDNRTEWGWEGKQLDPFKVLFTRHSQDIYKFTPNIVASTRNEIRRIEWYYFYWEKGYFNKTLIYCLSNLIFRSLIFLTIENYW